jgi:hypothetical protein
MMLPVGAPVAGAVALVLPFLHLAVVAVAPLAALIHLVLVRLLLVRDAWRVLGARRRRIGRWMLRLVFLWVGVPGYGLAAIPAAGVLLAAGVFAGLTTAAHHYVLWSLRREHQRAPAAAWERVVITVLVALTVALLAVTALVVLVVGWSLGALLGWLSEL